jgi:hypothetical protein
VGWGRSRIPVSSRHRLFSSTPGAQPLCAHKCALRWSMQPNASCVVLSVSASEQTCGRTGLKPAWAHRLDACPAQGAQAAGWAHAWGLAGTARPPSRQGRALRSLWACCDTPRLRRGHGPGRGAGRGAGRGDQAKGAGGKTRSVGWRRAAGDCLCQGWRGSRVRQCQDPPHKRAAP